MKKLFTLIVAMCFGAMCFAAPYELRLTQRDSADASNFTRSVPPASSSTTGILVYNGSTTLPQLADVGAGLSFNGTSLSAIAAAAPSQGVASRTLNSAFQVSATRAAIVFYSVQCTITASIAGGQNCDVILEIASDSGFTTNVQTIAISGTGQTYTLAVALQGVQPQTGGVSGWVPPAYYVRIRTIQNTGAPAFSYRAGQEVLF